jgi:hypothetical protein
LIAVSVPAAETLETTFTSKELFPLVASVETPVIIPFRYPLKGVVVPAPGMVTLLSAAVTATPIVAPYDPGLWFNTDCLVC